MLISAQVQEIVIDYTHCGTEAPLAAAGETKFATLPFGPGTGTTAHFKTELLASDTPEWQRVESNTSYHMGQPVASGTPNSWVNNNTVCQIIFMIPETIQPPVFFYYRLTNFYQNHRRYVKSLDQTQLLGKKKRSADEIKDNCAPLTTDPSGRPYYPCGLIANSQFNDTFSSPKPLNPPPNYKGPESYLMTNESIAWSSDANLYGDSSIYADNYTQIAVPPNWAKRWSEKGYTAENPPPNLKTYDEFQVWMRTAGLPAFTKLALRNKENEMAKGKYQVDIGLSMY